MLLVLGLGYLSNMGDPGSVDPVAVLSPEADVSTLDSLRLVLEEHKPPKFCAHSVVSDQQDNISMLAQS